MGNKKGGNEAYFDGRWDAEASGASGANGSENDFDCIVIVVVNVNAIVQFHYSSFADIDLFFFYDLFHATKLCL